MDMDIQKIRDIGSVAVAPRLLRTPRLLRSSNSPDIISLSDYRQLRTKDDSLLSDALKGTERAAIFTIRINRYEMLLETFSGSSGDQIASHVEKLLLSSLRETDFAVHVSAEEFVVLIRDVALITDIEDVAIRVIDACSYLEIHESQRIPISIDIGIANYPNDATDASDLLRFAHIALHSLDSDRHGNYQFYSENQRTDHREGIMMTGELIQAMQEDRMELHYQPIYCLKSDMIVSVEALVRLRTREGEIIPPDDFIDVAERTGLIVPLGAWVMKKACMQLASWQKCGAKDLCMSINVSPVQLGDPGFFDLLEAAVTESKIDFSSVEIEIVERQQVGTDVDLILSRLRNLGVKIAVDDFGTGYSSLANLARYPLDVVKIDQSFVRSMLENSVAKSIVSAICAIAEELNLNVIAEGVETIAQEKYLLSLGCQKAQGFGYSKPLLASALSRLFSNTPGGVFRYTLREGVM